ncbi:MAG TPA: flippase [Anaerolineae bacterium]|nr:flippase [Anaerolineae bacterium]
MTENIPESQPGQGLGRIIARNTAFITLGELALKALNVLFTIYVVRRLGDSQFGQYSIVLAFPGLFQIFAEFGMTQYVMREIARDRSKTQLYFWNLVVLRLALAIVAIVGITVSAVITGYPEILVLGIALHTCTFLLAAFAVPLETVLAANERLDYVATAAVVGRLAFILSCTVFLIAGKDFLWVVLAGLLTMPIQIGFSLWAIKRHKLAPDRFQINLRLWPHLIRSGLPFGIIMLALTIAYSIDTVMLSMFEPPEVVGWYNAAYNLIRTLMLVYTAFSIAVLPSLSRVYVSERTQVERWYHRSVKFSLLQGLPMAVGGMLVAYPLMRFLYTDEFLPSGLALQILIWDLPLVMYNSFCGNMTTVIGAERNAARIYSINAAANVILNLYAIPRFGLVGAALVTVVTDLIGALQFHLLLRDKLHLPNMTSVLVRTALAAAGMGAIVWLAGNSNLFVLIGLGALVYGGLVLLLRLIDESEWNMLRWLGRRLIGKVLPAKKAV